MEVNKEIRSDSMKKSWKNKIIQNLINLLGKLMMNISVVVTVNVRVCVSTGIIF